MLTLIEDINGMLFQHRIVVHMQKHRAHIFGIELTIIQVHIQTTKNISISKGDNRRIFDNSHGRRRDI